ncbi:alanyl-tRNA editing protein AlaX [archaeon]|nr:alanyl-tRNA editing protein AlaX [archaeon]|tara:strand:- start:106 stop:807 length:702 start_codon:yes stop_codon:yes gene_type:complete
MNNIYLKDSYQNELQTTIIKSDGRFIVLQDNIFYPQSGGQPTDTGTLTNNDQTSKVIFAKKIDGKVSLQTDTESLKKDDSVTAKIDWDRRYKFMRYHTASHILASAIYQDTGALITGNQLDLDKSRIDLNLEEFNREQFYEYQDKANEIIKSNLSITTENLPYNEAMKIKSIFRLKGVLPPTLKEIRIVKVGDYDIQACGGTHVKETKEIGKLKIISMDNKGKNNRRVYFTLE